MQSDESADKAITLMQIQQIIVIQTSSAAAAAVAAAVAGGESSYCTVELILLKH